MKAAEVLVKALENEGVTRIFGLPGEENLAVVEALRTSSIELVIVRQEQAAAFMAATYGRLTGKPGVCLATLGPGALNLTTGAAYAHLGAMPMIMITGQKGVLSERQGSFQVVDVVRTMRPLTKEARQIVSGGMIPTLVRSAFRIATEERPGPVHLELPEDVALEEVNVPLVLPHELNIELAPRSSVEHAARHLLKAKAPLVVLGAAASRPRLAGKLREFFTRAKIPYVTTQMGKGSVDHSSELYIGTAALTERDYVHEAIDRADVIITVGHDTSEKPPFIMKESVTVVHFGYIPARIEAVYFPQVEVIGDIGNALSLLADIVEDKLPNAGALLPLRDGILARILEGSTDHRWTPQRIVADVRKVIPPDGIVALDNGIYKIWFARNYRTSHANTLLLDNALATMGAGMPSALSAALLYPERCVMAVCGDGGFLMNVQELETAVRLSKHHKFSLVTLVLVDNAFGMIRWKQHIDGYKDYGMQFSNPDFVMLAQSFGACGHFVQEVDNFAPTLEKAFSEGGVHIVAVPIDYTDNVRVLIDELHKKYPIV